MWPLSEGRVAGANGDTAVPVRAGTLQERLSWCFVPAYCSCWRYGCRPAASARELSQDDASATRPRVCTGIDAIPPVGGRRARARRKAAEIRQVLDRGYRLHESCRTVEASKAPEIVCPSSASRSGDTRCKQRAERQITSASAGIFRCRSTAHWKRKLAEHDAQARARATEKPAVSALVTQVLPMSR